MSRSAEQKIRLLVLYDILHKETDAEHQLSTNELIERLATYGIQATRQTVYDDIEMLNSFGYEIITVHGRNNRYFIDQLMSGEGKVFMRSRSRNTRSDFVVIIRFVPLPCISSRKARVRQNISS